MLQFDVQIPEGVQDGAPLIVLLHGRGSDAEDIMGLRPALPAEAIVAAPQAPFPAAPWGYGPGWAWYRFLGRNRPEPDTFETSQSELQEFLKELPGHLPVKPGPVALGGFSQGGTMSLAHALRHPGRVSLVINLSGFLADHPSVAARPDTARGAKFFWAHGASDAMIPLALAQEGWRLLQSAGADLTVREYPIGHWVDRQELADLAAWLRAGWAGPDRPGSV